uniref:Uncharacterized protein n=1 Tax=Nelumbo nucifera TaxID=4432 RepID=A0A822YMT8_NELNU|nr:TPA_asm: hypothetical protein HUJ06_012648 [Nelumbo nucifera]
MCQWMLAASCGLSWPVIGRLFWVYCAVYCKDFWGYFIALLSGPGKNQVSS